MQVTSWRIYFCSVRQTSPQKNPKRFAKYHNNFDIVKAKIEEVEARDHVRNFQPPVTGEENHAYFLH